MAGINANGISTILFKNLANKYAKMNDDRDNESSSSSTNSSSSKYTPMTTQSDDDGNKKTHDDNEKQIEAQCTTNYHLWKCGLWTSANEPLVINFCTKNDRESGRGDHMRKNSERDMMSSLTDSDDDREFDSYSAIPNTKIINISNEDNFFVNLNSPLLTIIKPNSFDNILLLSRLHPARFVVCCCLLFAL